MFAILALGDENNGAHRNAMNPLLIGILIAVIGGSLGPLTGFAMNPARDFGPKLFAYLAGWDYALTGAKDIPYFIVPIIGLLLVLVLVRGHIRNLSLFIYQQSAPDVPSRTNVMT